MILYFLEAGHKRNNHYNKGTILLAYVNQRRRVKSYSLRKTQKVVCTLLAKFQPSKQPVKLVPMNIVVSFPVIVIKVKSTYIYGVPYYVLPSNIFPCQQTKTVSHGIDYQDSQQDILCAL